MKVRLVTLVAVSTLWTSCHRATTPQLPEPVDAVPEAAAADVSTTVFLVGDVGAALWERSPLPHRLAAEIERWSGALHRDSSVSILFLGDNIYPKGLRTDPAFFAQDSAHLEAQVDVLSGPNARRYHAFGLFVAGNHDWGHQFGAPGEQRVRNQEEFLGRRRQRGISVQLLPKAGTPGPGVVDVGTKLRFVLLDTAWWLLSADRDEKQRTMDRLEGAMRSAGGRDVIMAAHHPMKSASVHGGTISLFDLFGVKWLLNKSGASLQDLNSLPYRDLLSRLDTVFRRTGPPLVFAGGHDHSIQLIRAVRDVEPRFMIVSGAGSKSSKIGVKTGMVYRSKGPGYVQLTFRKDGGVVLAVYTAPPSFLMCDMTSASVQHNCVETGTGEFHRVYSILLR